VNTYTRGIHPPSARSLSPLACPLAYRLATCGVKRTGQWRGDVRRGAAGFSREVGRPWDGASFFRPARHKICRFGTVLPVNQSLGSALEKTKPNNAKPN